MQEQGCGALWNLSSLAENQAKVAEAGGIGAVASAMRQHEGDAGVQEQGCGALWDLSLLAENQANVAEAGGIGAVVSAMRLLLLSAANS